MNGAESRGGGPAFGRERRPWLTALACISLVCMMAAGCSGVPSKPGGWITGKLSGVLGGPVAPRGAKLTSIQGKVEILKGQKIFVTVKASQNGFFKVSVPTGYYAIRALPLSRVYAGCSSKPAQVQIAAHQVVRVSVTCMSTVG